jgi:hypothetical membrane protein
MAHRTGPAWVGGVVGPGGFVLAWLAAGAATKGYSPVEDAISRLAADGAPTRWLMSTGFVGFGIGLPVYAIALRRALPGRAWLTAALSGVTTLGVAAFPLDRSAAGDRAHALAAGAGYVALALTPLLASSALRRVGYRRSAVASIATAAASAVCLAGSTIGPTSGLLQRTGLTLVDAWIVVTAVGIVRERTAPSRGALAVSRRC